MAIFYMSVRPRPVPPTSAGAWRRCWRLALQ